MQTNKTLAAGSYILQELVHECFLKTNHFLEFREFLSALQKVSEIAHSQTLSFSLSCCPSFHYFLESLSLFMSTPHFAQAPNLGIALDAFFKTPHPIALCQQLLLDLIANMPRNLLPLTTHTAVFLVQATQYLIWIFAQTQMAF